MGIKGLHKALAFCTVKDNLRNYRNTILAVDTSSWMHKSVYSISEKFVESTARGSLDQGCVRVSARYIIGRCKELIEAFGIRAVYLVMDGKRIPLKAEESQDRDQKRLQNLEEARRFKRTGQRWKAEDRYKSCIRIKDDFTRAVIREVEQAFCKYGRVFFVNSPHEADSQLTRLVLDGVADAVITEDSDVLVYSAAAHKAFPILFKLDRKTGACDSINMEWLISPSPKETAKAVASKNTLEFILRRFASKQVSTRGVGVRLFVQGCILSGCDYRKNIEGIGTTNAFKLVSENAFRGACVRFRKILESLPKKVRQKIDIDEHEEILAKSEAIFFYHPVLHKDRKVKPLLTPRISPEEKAVKPHHTDYYPCMSRFQSDWSFLGTTSSSSNLSMLGSGEATNRNKSHEPLVTTKSTTIEESSTLPKETAIPSRSSPSAPMQILHNPYKKSKLFDNKGALPLEERNTNAHMNTGTEIIGRKKRGIGDITKFLVKPDPRFARSTFASTGIRKRSITGTRVFEFSTASSSFRLSSSSTGSKKSPGQSFFEKRTTATPNASRTTSGTGTDSCQLNYRTTENDASHASFSYPSFNESSPDESRGKGTKRNRFNSLSDEFQNLDRKLYEQDFFDLTNSNSSEIDDVDNGTRDEGTESKGVIEEDQVITLPSNTEFEANVKDNTNSGDSSDPPSHLREVDSKDRQETKDIDTEQATSRYFSGRSNSRRVTLDPSSPPPSDGFSSVACEKPMPLEPEDDDIISSPETHKKVVQGKDWELDECIDDPDDEFLAVDAKPASRMGSSTERLKSTPPSPRGNAKSSLSRSKGCIGSFFKRQEQFASQLRQSTQSQTRRQFPKKNPKNFFSPERYTKKTKLSANSSNRLNGKSLDDSLFKKSIALSQLNLKRCQSQSSDDYLWNGTP